MRFDDIENKQLPKGLVPRENLEIQADDVLITRAGPRVRVGICCHVKRTRSKLILCDKVYRLRVNNQIVLPGFIEIQLNSPLIMQEIELMKTGISDSGLNLT